MKTQEHERRTVFISYSHQDKNWLERLRIHLRPLEREYEIEIWDDTKIGPGSTWQDEIKTALDNAKVAVLLISADFLGSDFIATNELPPLLNAAEQDGATILPVIISPSRYVKTRSLSQFQSVNDPSKPLLSLSKAEQETVLVKVTECIETLLTPQSSTRTERANSTEQVGEQQKLEPLAKGKYLTKFRPDTAEHEQLHEDKKRPQRPKLRVTFVVCGSLLILVGILFSISLFRQRINNSPNHGNGHTPRYFRQKEANTGVIIFVHGILGDSISTWTNSKTNSYWPRLLTEDTAFDGYDLYIFEYPSPAFSTSYSIDELADNIRAFLIQDKVFEHQEVIFLMHSMGGLITRAFLLKYREFIPKVRFLFFFATPTTGSELARIASVFSDNPQLQKLVTMTSDSYLADQQRAWFAAKIDIPSYCAYEKRLTYGHLVVEQQSASNLCNRELNPVDENHVDIVKPAGPRDVPYILFKNAFSANSPQPVTYNEDVASFYYNYEYDDPNGKGRRQWWRKDRDTWIERYPNGKQSAIHIIGRTTVDGDSGFLLQSVQSPEYHYFIPSKGSSIMRLRIRFKKEKWVELGEMEGIEYKALDPIRQFWIDYPYEPEPGKRVWSLINNSIWTEGYPSGKEARFKIIRRQSVEGNKGVVLVAHTEDSSGLQNTNEASFEIFIPDNGSQYMMVWFRHKQASTWGDWKKLGEMKSIR